ncbi:DUF2004 domain-containing protein [Paramicrobacterium fandaimingii]|uniref:DUF2004 domain-containing protein n=1 Tax=Paramicrobacterium fandaimingii TaxID=2708079 RepID=UPI0014233EB1|nr:DUF2004 domain-containing protein [Microbacterium fandaimingii]
MGIEHDYFGVIESDASGALFWSESVEAGDQSVDVTLSTPPQVTVSDEALEVAQAMIATLEGLDLRAREALVAELGTPASDVAAFLLEIEERFGSELTAFITRESGDLGIDVIRSLELLRVAFHPHQIGEGDSFVSLEFALAPDENELALLVHLSMSGEPVSTDFLD